MKFSAGQGMTDLVVIPVHFKSNRAAFAGQDTAAQRDLEAEMLLAALPQVRARFGGDEDVVVLGDTNVLNKDEEAVAAFRAARFVDLNAADQPTYVSGQFQNPFDRAFVPDAAGNPQAQEFAQAGLDVFKHPPLSAAQYRRAISDHRMIRITLAVLADDD
jgi:predicted extracellular nuclease